MQIILAYVAWGTLFSLLSGLPKQPIATKADVKLPSQLKLHEYLGHSEKALNTSWIIESKFKCQVKSSFDTPDEMTGRILLLRVPLLPEVFLWQSTEKGKPKSDFFKLHIGRSRLLWSQGFHDIGFDLPFGGLHLDWVYFDSIWKNLSGATLIWDASGSYDVVFSRPTLILRRDEKGWVQTVFENVIASRGPMGLLLGMDAKQTVKRFEVKLTKVDNNYLYIEAFPKRQEDKALFVRSQVVFDKNSFLPRRLWYAEADKSTTTYNLSQTFTWP